jgi:hypothetical protein
MAQRISRAKRTVGRAGLDRPGDVRTVMRVLYLVFNEGYSGDVDLAAEAIRLTRQLAAMVDDPEVDGLLALMLLHHARRAQPHPTPTADRAARRAGPQPWDTELIAEGVAVLQAALARDRLGEYQAQAAIAALHADAPRFEETDWVQIVEWYDELLGSPTPRSSGSTGPSPSARPTARPPAWRRWPRSTRTSPGATRSPPTSTRSNGDLELAAPASTPRGPQRAPTSPSATTRPARRRGSTKTTGGPAPRSR